MGPDPTNRESQRTRTTAHNTTEMTQMTVHDTDTTAETRVQEETRPAMSQVDQTHPDTNRSFGFAVYGRVAADGGREQEAESMRDVDHESDTGGSNRTFERGTGGDE